ncbi:MAG: SRPBCC domain-containing protein [Nannocystaceae bacterium]
MTNKAMITTPSDRTVRIERIFDAPRERVWRALTDPAQLACWWGRGNPLVIERFDLRPGGHWRFVEHSDHGVHGFEGRFAEIDPPSRVVQTFEWDGLPGHVALETMTLEDLGDGRTRMVVLSLFHTVEDRDGMLHSGMEGGLAQSHAALDAVLAGTAPRPPLPGVIRKVAFTMVPVVDVERARRFYEQTLGLRVGMAGGKGGMHWVEYDLPGGGCIALTNTTGAQPSTNAGATVALEVVDLRPLIERLRAEGVAIVGEVVAGPRCIMQMCKDSEGNALLLHQLSRAGA